MKCLKCFICHIFVFFIIKKLAGCELFIIFALRKSKKAMSFHNLKTKNLVVGCQKVIETYYYKMFTPPDIIALAN